MQNCALGAELSDLNQEVHDGVARLVRCVLAEQQQVFLGAKHQLVEHAGCRLVHGWQLGAFLGLLACLDFSCLVFVTPCPVVEVSVSLVIIEQIMTIHTPNTPEAAIAFLATVSIGAIWSLCAPDMGTHAVLDRFQQITPKVLIACDGVTYGGRDLDRTAVVAELCAALPSVQHVILHSNLGLESKENATTLIAVYVVLKRAAGTFDMQNRHGRQRSISLWKLLNPAL